MAVYDFKLRLISPAFIAGTDKDRPEMRAASIRGQLRYWLRAIIGASTHSLATVWDRESAVFGSTSSSSVVSVRVYRDGSTKSDDCPMLPHRANEGRRGLPIQKQKALSPGQIYSLQLVTRPGTTLPPDALNALALWSLLGGIGRRSRRMFGAVQITASEGMSEWYTQPQTPDDLVNLIHNTLERVASAPPHHNIPDFPTLNRAYSWVIVGQTPYASYEDAVISLFRDLLRADRFRSKQDTFGQAMGGRRASPLIAQVRRIRIEGKDLYYPVLTAFRSKPDTRWQHLKLFMQDAETHFSAVRVWGGW